MNCPEKDISCEWCGISRKILYDTKKECLADVAVTYSLNPLVVSEFIACNECLNKKRSENELSGL